MPRQRRRINYILSPDTQGEGFWTLLGSYSFTAGQQYTVLLSDQANGSVSADAIYVVETPAPPPPAEPDAVSWVPDLPAASDYEVFIKYTADGTRATDAQYTIVHSTGSATIPVDQTQNGGIWQSLGTYSFDAGTGGSISVEASENGTVSADAVRFVTESAPSGGLAYILTDHLGTPQKLVDASKAVIWDRVQTPFGITHSETASTTRQTNVRFPGQWADAETGLSYNYFRSYDPTMGRYMQSDPIGLNGGLNTYGYVGGNPLAYVDPRGENPLQGCITGGAVGAGVAGVGVAPGCVIGGLIGLGVTAWAISELADGIDAPSLPPGSPRDNCDNDDDGCDEEWETAFKRCEDLWSQDWKPFPYRDLLHCAKGLVSERCGGNPVQH